MKGPLLMARPLPPQRPQALELITHPVKTMRLTAALLRDPQVSLPRRLLFSLPLLLLFVALLVPDTLIGGLISAAIPVVGPIVGIPGDAALDWLALGVAGVSLLHLFPSVILDEQYHRIFHSKRAVVVATPPAL
jgi:hypothetical protein